jgi:hypothetical protein
MGVPAQESSIGVQLCDDFISVPHIVPREGTDKLSHRHDCLGSMNYKLLF